MPVEGAITLPVTVHIEPYQRTLRLTFLVINVPSAYNVILERPSLNAFRAVVSTYHLLVKFLSYLLATNESTLTPWKFSDIICTFR